MANVESRNEQQESARKRSSTAMERPRQSTAQQAVEPWTGRTGAFGLLRRLSDDMDRLFASVFRMTPREEQFEFDGLMGWPDLEVYRRDNKLVARADVPGLRKEDVSVEVRGDQLCISGERHRESEQTGREYYRTERAYGSFCRTIPLPEGAKVDTASATFQNGVLEVEIEVPPQAPQGRTIEVKEGPSH
jgi:HSP20 family protein